MLAELTTLLTAFDLSSKSLVELSPAAMNRVAYYGNLAISMYRRICE